jgi:hypothetical protein
MALMEQVISAAKKPWGLSQCQEVWVADFAWLKGKGRAGARLLAILFRLWP